MKKLLTSSVLLVAGPASAAVIAFGGGDTAAGDVTGTPGNFVLDAGFYVPFVNTTDPVLFETGGDGIGTSLAMVGNNLEVFQDQNQGAEATLTLDISSFLGQVISIRFNGDFRPANGSRILSLAVEPTTGAPISAANTTITSFDNRFSGGDGTGFGGVNGTLGGNGGADTGSQVMNFDNAARDLAGPGSSVLGDDVLVGNLYTAGNADTQRGVALPTAASYASQIPEPASALMLLLGSLGLLARKRR